MDGLNLLCKVRTFAECSEVKLSLEDFKRAETCGCTNCIKFKFLSRFLNLALSGVVSSMSELL